MTRQRAVEGKWILVAPLIAAVPAGLFMTFVALSHNPQGVFDDGEHVYFDAIFAVFFAWFAPVYLYGLLVGAVFYGPYRLGLKYGFVARTSRADDDAVASPNEVGLVWILSVAAALVAAGYAAFWMLAP